jgi:hypothetical protein
VHDKLGKSLVVGGTNCAHDDARIRVLRMRHSPASDRNDAALDSLDDRGNAIADAEFPDRV